MKKCQKCEVRMEKETQEQAKDLWELKCAAENRNPTFDVFGESFEYISEKIAELRKNYVWPLCDHC